jgi:hypothetical protein
MVTILVDYISTEHSIGQNTSYLKNSKIFSTICTNQFAFETFLYPFK